IGFGDTASVSLNFSSPTGFAYANIHVDYGLKGTTGWSKAELGSTTGLDAKQNIASPPLPNILNYQKYAFSETDGTPDSQTVTSTNWFKQDPVTGGLVPKSGSPDPLPNEPVKIAGDGKTTTVYTDADGWYMYTFKYTGKATTFTVTLPNRNMSQQVSLK